MPTFHLVDALLALVIVLALAGGWRRGFVLGTLDLAVLAAGLALAVWATPWLDAWLKPRNGAPGALGVCTAPLLFVLVLVVARALLGRLAARAAEAVPPSTRQHLINHLFGLLPGAANGLINATLLAVLLLLLPGADAINAAARRGVLVARLTPPAQWLEARLAPVFMPADKTLTALAVEPGNNGVVTLPFKVSDPQPRPDLEAQMLQMLNAERLGHGVPPLQADPLLAAVARAHSADMFEQGYFSHLTPAHRDPFDRMRAAHVGFLAAGENIALAPSLALAEHGLMNSPGHRANILRPAFGRVGIGIVDGGLRGLMVTQDFRN